MRGSICWAAQFFDDPCDGRYDRMHIGLQKQTLRQVHVTETRKKERGEPYRASIADTERLLFCWDHRLVRDGCRHHHERLDGPWFKLTREQIPESVERFAAEHGLTHRLERDFGPLEPEPIAA